MKEDLKYIFANINEWLKFAEAKNAGILAINAASIIGILQANITFNTGLTWCDKSGFFTGLLIAIFALSSAICMYSIVPTLSRKFPLYNKLSTNEYQTQKNTLNHLFFGDIAKLTNLQFVDLFITKNNISSALNEAELDIAAQIVINAEIALQKFKLFNFASWITFCNALFAMVLLLIHVF